MLKYFSIGQGDNKVLVLHGWKMDHTCFTPLQSALDTEHFTYFFIDQQGYGLSIDEKGPYTIEQVAKDTLELAESLNLNQFYLIGHSMGGKVLSRILADAPDKVIAAMGITPCPPVPIPFDEEGRNMFRKAATDISCREEIFRISTGNRLTDTWYRTIAELSMKSSTADAFADYFEEWADYECRADVEGCTIPVKIMAGEFDPHLTYDWMKMTYGEWLPNCEVIELKNCGHYPMYEIPLTLAAECEKFMKANKAPK